MSSISALRPRRARGFLSSVVVGLTVGAALLAPRSTSAAEPAVCSSPNPADWPAPAKPYFMIIVDTSGSMGSTVSTNNSCGYPNNRIGHARCAVKNTVQAFSGEANFGLASYAWRLTGCSATCFNNCNAQYPAGTSNFCGIPTNDSGIGGGNNIHRGAYIEVPMLQDHFWSQPPDPSNAGTILGYVDNNCTGSVELGANSNTPLGGALFSMYQYFSGTYVDPFTGTTLASPVGPSGLERTCRALNVILITDGDETCSDNGGGIAPNATPIPGGCRNGFAGYLNNNNQAIASYEADKMWHTGVTVNGMNFKVKTSVIGFAGATVASLDNIASCGGSGASYSTANEADLSSALANIIGGSIKPEDCNNADDNCNGCTDEGYKHYCNENRTPSTNPTQIGQCCSAARATCLTNYQNSITAGNPQGDRWWLPCWTPTAGNTTPEKDWLCTNPGEICDNLDNNCDKTIDPAQLATNTQDEGFNKCGSPLHCPTAETCDGTDQDCDNIIDNSAGSSIPYSACPNSCQPSPEICDGCDDNCDGIIDNGVATITCGFSPPATCQGTESCTQLSPPNYGGKATYIDGSGHTCVQGGGTWSACTGQTTSAETCNGIDDNCNGIIDDGVPTQTCDVPPGTNGYPGPYNYGPNSQCKRGTKQCVSGAYGACTGWVGPSAEICDGIDNDCNGVVDDNIPGLGQPCGSATGQCQKGITACDSTLGQIVCQGGTPPQPETCNGKDDDCNGVTDDNLTDAPPAGSTGCWNDPGTCCTYLNYKWCPPTGATCGGLGTLTTPCATGNLTCNGVSGWTCSNPKKPSPEVCDGVDNNCNGSTDEGLGSPVGDACGLNVGECKPGVNACSNGNIVCQGGVGPTQEVCNGKDDDCDGQIDNGIGLGGSCQATYDHTQYPDPPGAPAGYSRDQGSCKPGTLQCDPGGSGQTICNGGVGPQPEICDGIDNDCDGVIDEPGQAPDGIDGSVDPNDPTKHLGDSCGSNVGECKAGKLSCINGQVICSGGVGPQPEICDCKDNNCDGKIDENNPPVDGGAGSNICSSGKTCVEVSANFCQCAPPCGTGEFKCSQSGTTCDTNAKPSGNNNDPPSTTGYCVKDNCGDCSTKTHNDAKGNVVCGPAGTVTDGGTSLPVCVCTASGCDSPCAGITCPAGQECAPTGPQAGTCQQDTNCFFFPCSTGQVCNAKVCVDDPCDPNPCQAGEVCKPSSDFKSARCVGSCAGVTCQTGEVCKEGACVATGCAQPCPSGQYCIGDGDGGFSCQPGKCTGDGGAACSDGFYCDPTTGSCGNDPCDGVVCPAAQVCQNGDCVWAPETGTGGTGGTSGTGGTGGSSASGGTGGTGGNQVDGSSGTSGNGATGGNGQPPGVFGLATGGGGCACRTTGSRNNLPGTGTVLLGLGLALGLSRRRRNRPRSRAAARTEGGRK